MDFYILLISFFIIALVYASVGFGGGTSYLALMGVMAVSFEVMRQRGIRKVFAFDKHFDEQGFDMIP